MTGACPRHSGRRDIPARHRPENPPRTCGARAGRGLGLALALTLSGVLPALGAVETALIVSRDTPDRLVLAHWPRNGWAVTRGERQTVILFPQEHLDIEPTRSISPETGGRIENLHSEQTSEGTRLVLDFRCDCFAALRRDGPSGLSIEILDAEDAAWSAEGPSGPAAEVSPLPVPRVAASVRSQQQRADGEDGTHLEAVRRRLVAQLERAAAAGLITLADNGAIATRRGPRDGSPEGTAEAPRPEHPRLTAQSSRAGPTPLNAVRGAAQPPATSVAVSSTAEGEGGVPTVAVALTPPGPGQADQGSTADCPPEALLSLHSATEGRGPAAAIARLRRGLLGEFDDPVSDVAIALAKFYMGNGLLAEADLVLSRFAADGVEKSVLETLSKIIRGESIAPGSGFGTPDCGQAHALWHAAAAASDGRPREALTLMRQGGERSLQTLRGSLRDRFATRMARAALEVGDEATADRYLSLAMRSSLAAQPLASSVERLAARLARRRGKAAEAVERLRRVWGRFPGDPESAEAMLQLADMILEGEVESAGDTRTLRLDLGALALAARGTPTGARAIVAEAGLAAQAFGRSAGLDLLALARRQETLSGETYAEAVRGLSGETFARPGETPLALLFERETARYRPVLSDPAFRAALAMSYADIGLPEKARGVLNDGDLAQPRLARTLARTYLALGEAESAREMAQHLPAGKVRARIVARALEMQGRPGEALGHLLAAEAGPAEDRARLAWAAGAWDSAAEALAEQMTASPRPDIAARLAVARQRAGASAMIGPDRTAQRPGAPPAQPKTTAPAFTPTAKGVAGYLEFLKAETEAIREVLGDG